MEDYELNEEFDKARLHLLGVTETKRRDKRENPDKRKHVNILES